MSSPLTVGILECAVPKVHPFKEECSECSRSHKSLGFDPNDTPGCLYVSQNKYVCTQPKHYENASATGRCADFLCPKYAQCFAKLWDNSYYELQCRFNTQLLPEPPMVARMKKLMKKIAVESKISVQHLEALTGNKFEEEDVASSVKEKIAKSCAKSEDKPPPKKSKFSVSMFIKELVTF